MNSKNYKILSICCGFFSGIFLLFGILGSLIFEKYLTSIENDNAILSKVNQEQWGEFPGKTNTNIFYKYSLFNFSNPFETIFENKYANLNLTNSITYQRYMNLKEIKFEDNDNKVSYKEYNQLKFLKNGKKLK